MKLPQRPSIQISLSSDEFESLARELAIDRQVRMFPKEQEPLIREFITNLWEDGNSPTDKKQREDYRRDAQVAINYLLSVQLFKRNKRNRKKIRKSVSPSTPAAKTVSCPDDTSPPDIFTTVIPAIL